MRLSRGSCRIRSQRWEARRTRRRTGCIIIVIVVTCDMVFVLDQSCRLLQRKQEVLYLVTSESRVGVVSNSSTTGRFMMLRRIVMVVCAYRPTSSASTIDNSIPIVIGMMMIIVITVPTAQVFEKAVLNGFKWQF